MCKKVGMRKLVLQPFKKVAPTMKIIFKIDTLDMNFKD